MKIYRAGRQLNRTKQDKYCTIPLYYQIMSVEGKVLTVHRRAQKCALTPLPTATCATFLLNHDYKYLFHLVHANHQCFYLYSLLYRKHQVLLLFQPPLCVVLTSGATAVQLSLCQPSGATIFCTLYSLLRRNYQILLLFKPPLYQRQVLPLYVKPL